MLRWIAVGRAGNPAVAPDATPTTHIARFGNLLTDDAAMPLKVRSSGCLVSIVASVLLTVVLNLMLHACSG